MIKEKYVFPWILHIRESETHDCFAGSGFTDESFLLALALSLCVFVLIPFSTYILHLPFYRLLTLYVARVSTFVFVINVSGMARRNEK